MLKILFSSQKGDADKFVDWATETLFTVQMGTSDQKETLASTLIGQSVQNVRAVFNTCAKKVPCICRFALGKAKQFLDILVRYVRNINYTKKKLNLEKMIQLRKINYLNLSLLNIQNIDYLLHFEHLKHLDISCTDVSTLPDLSNQELN